MNSSTRVESLVIGRNQSPTRRSVHLDPVPCLLRPPPNEHTSEGGETIEGSRTMRNRPYPVLSSAQVLKNRARTGHQRGMGEDAGQRR